MQCCVSRYHPVNLAEKGMRFDITRVVGASTQSLVGNSHQQPSKEGTRSSGDVLQKTCTYHEKDATLNNTATWQPRMSTLQFFWYTHANIHRHTITQMIALCTGCWDMAQLAANGHSASGFVRCTSIQRTSVALN